MYAVHSARSTLLLQVDIDLNIDPAVGLGGGAVGVFLTTLILGFILVALSPKYTEDRMARVVDDPLGTFLSGFIVLLLLFLVVFLLAITVIGVLVAFPLLVLSYVVWLFGSTVAYLAIADRLVGHEDGWTAPILVAAGLSGALVLTGVGTVLGFAIGAVGFGAVMEPYLE